MLAPSFMGLFLLRHSHLLGSNANSKRRGSKCLFLKRKKQRITKHRLVKRAAIAKPSTRRRRRPSSSNKNRRRPFYLKAEEQSTTTGTVTSPIEILSSSDDVDDDDDYRSVCSDHNTNDNEQSVLNKNVTTTSIVVVKKEDPAKKQQQTTQPPQDPLLQCRVQLLCQKLGLLEVSIDSGDDNSSTLSDNTNNNNHNTTSGVVLLVQDILQEFRHQRDILAKQKNGTKAFPYLKHYWYEITDEETKENAKGDFRRRASSMFKFHPAPPLVLSSRVNNNHKNSAMASQFFNQGNLFELAVDPTFVLKTLTLCAQHLDMPYILDYFVGKYRAPKTKRPHSCGKLHLPVPHWETRRPLTDWDTDLTFMHPMTEEACVTFVQQLLECGMGPLMAPLFQILQTSQLKLYHCGILAVSESDGAAVHADAEPQGIVTVEVPLILPNVEDPELKVFPWARSKKEIDTQSYKTYKFQKDRALVMTTQAYHATNAFGKCSNGEYRLMLHLMFGTHIPLEDRKKFAGPAYMGFIKEGDGVPLGKWLHKHVFTMEQGQVKFQYPLEQQRSGSPSMIDGSEATTADPGRRSFYRRRAKGARSALPLLNGRTTDEESTQQRTFRMKKRVR